MGTFFKMLKFLTSISVLVSISYGVKEQDKTIDLTTLIGAGAGAAVGSIPGGLIGNGLGSLAGNTLFQNDPLLSGLTGLAGTGAGALAGAGIGAATGAVAAPAVAGVIDDVLG